MQGFLRRGEPHVRVGVDRPTAAADVLRMAGWRVESGDGGLRVMSRGAVEADAAAVARVLGLAGLWPHELTTERQSLERVFLELTAGGDLNSTQGQVG